MKKFFYLTLFFLGWAFVSAEEEKNGAEIGAGSKPILNYYFLEG